MNSIVSAQAAHTSLATLPIAGHMQGVVRVIGQVLQLSGGGDAFIQFKLADCTGSRRAYAWCDQLVVPAHLEFHALVRVAMYLEQGRAGLCARITHMQEANERMLLSLPALTTLPRSHCVNHDAFDRLLALVRGLTISPLRNFVSLVLEQPRISAGFLTARASWRHHHREAGGLLLHSVEVAEFVRDAPHTSTLEQELAIVCALLHDIGKVATHGEHSSFRIPGS